MRERVVGAMVDKLPHFDNSWSDAYKSSWFDAFLAIQSAVASHFFSTPRYDECAAGWRAGLVSPASPA